MENAVNPLHEKIPPLTGKARALANLRPCVKGEVRNPSGKTGLDPRLELNRFLATIVSDDPKKRTKLAIFIESMFQHAIDGDASFARIIMDRIAPATQIADISVNLATSDEHKELLHRLRHGETVIRFNGNGNGNGHATDRVLPSAN